MQTLSIVITNFNYAKYVGAAIESALAVDWPSVEVVVVDDGSTDDSAEVLQHYSGVVKIMYTRNQGQRVAANLGFGLTSGDVVVFLDADDRVPPYLGRAIDEEMSAEVSKVQFSMQRVDDSGNSLGRPIPHLRYTPTPDQIRRWAVTTSAYPTPPGSGNAYSRWFLDLVMPVGSAVGDAADTALLAAAPLLGSVRVRQDVVIDYRIHGDNDSNLLRDRTRFQREVQRAEARLSYAQAVSGRSADRAPLRRSRELLQFRAASLRVQSSGPNCLEDSRLRIIVDALRSPVWPGYESASHRLLIVSWVLLVTLAPGRVVEGLINKRYGTFW